MQKTISGENAMKVASQSPPISRETLLSPILLFALITSTVMFYSCGFFYIARLYTHDPTIPVPAGNMRQNLPFAIGEGDENCDIFSGRWVRDYDRPLYEESDCPYIGGQLSCLQHGRPDKDYRYWRWQPHGCSIPSFNATLMLEALRGKKVIFVGDSLNRGQFISLLCLLHSVIPQHAHSIETIDSLSAFTAKDYNATIEFHWTPFLVESNADDPDMHRVNHRIIRNAPIGKRGQLWKHADIILFNTYIWWAEGVNLLLRGSFEDEVRETIRIPMEDGYLVAIRAMIEWINDNIDPKRTRVFFVGLSATHQGSAKWGGDPKGNCYNETLMIEDPTFVGATRSLGTIVSEEIKKSEVPITILNITQLTSPRKDAHTSIYKAQRHPLTNWQQANPTAYADCIHWCMPGVPDVWNELFFSKLFYP